MEQWRGVPGFEGLYSVSDQGRVMRHASRIRHGRGWGNKPERIIPPTSTNGYLVVNLWRNSKAKMSPVHRLVMLAFQGPSQLSVDHINGVKDDNRLENLRYCTLAENTRYQHEAGRTRFVRGDRNGKSKMNTEMVRCARQLLADGWSRAAVASEFGVSAGAIQAIHDGRTWKHVT